MGARQLQALVRGRLNLKNTRSDFKSHQPASTHEAHGLVQSRHPTFKETRSATTRSKPPMLAAATGALSPEARQTQPFPFVRLNVRGEREQPLQLCVRHKPLNARHHPPRTQRDYDQVNDESRAIRGRVHAVVRPRRPCGTLHWTPLFFIHSDCFRSIPAQCLAACVVISAMVLSLKATPEKRVIVLSSRPSRIARAKALYWEELCRINCAP